MALRLIVVDDHEIVRYGMRKLLEDTDIKVVGEASTSEQVLAMLSEKKADVMLLDVRLGQQDGLKLLARVKNAWPDLKVIMFSNFDHPLYMTRAEGRGASGYLLKTISREDLIEAIHTAAATGNVWTQVDIRQVTSASATLRLEIDVDVPLTNTECEVLKYMAEGMTNKEIAVMLHLKLDAVKEHVKHILRKIGVSDRTQAAIWAVRNGLA
jgi:DNA-binding NarL/FixJ family response regulator